MGLVDDWIKGKIDAVDEAFSNADVSRLKEFHSSSKLKKLAITQLANEMTDIVLNKAKKQHLEDLFRSLDKNGDGNLSKNEIQEAVAKMASEGKTSCDTGKLVTWLEKLDTDKS